MLKHECLALYSNETVNIKKIKNKKLSAENDSLSFYDSKCMKRTNKIPIVPSRTKLKAMETNNSYQPKKKMPAEFE